MVITAMTISTSTMVKPPRLLAPHRGGKRHRPLGGDGEGKRRRPLGGDGGGKRRSPAADVIDVLLFSLDRLVRLVRAGGVDVEVPSVHVRLARAGLVFVVDEGLSPGIDHVLRDPRVEELLVGGLAVRILVRGIVIADHHVVLLDLPVGSAGTALALRWPLA